MQRLILSLLVAADEQNLIGNKNQLPWHLPNDLRYFKNLTWGMPILMGRKTFESIGKPLPGRKNIVISRNHHWKHEGVPVVHSVDEAIRSAEAMDVKEIFVIGGAEIFNTAMDMASRVYLTRIHHRFEGDVYFPSLAKEEWTLTRQRHCYPDEKNPWAHSFQVWERTGIVGSMIV